MIEHNEVTVEIGTDVLTTVAVIILPLQPVFVTAVYAIGNVMEPLNVKPPVSTTDVHDNCVQLKVPVSMSEVHDNCVQLIVPVSISEVHVNCAQLFDFLKKRLYLVALLDKLVMLPMIV